MSLSMLKQDPADLAIEKVYESLNTMDPTSSDYGQAVKNLEGLYRIKSERSKSRLNPNTVLTVCAYTGMGVMILVAEVYGHTFTSKAAQFAWPKLAIR